MHQPLQINTLFRGFAWALCLLMLLGCEPFKLPKKELPPRGQPAITTLPVTNVTATSATLNLILTSTGNAVIRQWGFCYSTTNQLPTIADSKVEGSGALPLNSEKTSMMPANAMIEGTTYYIRAYAINTSGQPAYGEPRQLRVPLVTGLIAHYRFTNNSNDEAPTGTAQNGQMKGGATHGPDRRTAPSPGSLALDGIDDYVEVDDHLDLRPPSITISLWMKPESLGTNQMQIFYKGNFTGSTGEQYSSKMYRVGNLIRINVDVKQNSKCNPGQWQTLSYDSDLSLGVYHHLALVYDGPNSKLHLYVDGVSRKEVTTNAQSIDNCEGGNLRFGAQVQGYEDYFKGQMDDIRIYSRALGPKDIKFLSEE